MGLFTRRRKPATDTGGLGVSLIALRLDEGDIAPAQSTVVVFNAGGHARRAVAGRVSCGQGETVFCFHPGPYTMDVIPFAAAPEWGLRLRFVVDAANPRVTQQRFDLYLYSETQGRLELAGFGAAVEAALQLELAQGALDLPPCTALEEWHAFRAGLNQLMYTRYGVTVEDCLPVDLGDQIDFAEILKERAQAAVIVAPEAIADHTAIAAEGIAAAVENVDANADKRSVDVEHTLTTEAAVTEPASVLSAQQPLVSSGHSSPRAAVAQQDAQALRRLFLELPALSSGLRLLSLPGGLTIFEQHQSLLTRLVMAGLDVGTMPALAWAAPDQPLEPQEQLRRSRQTLIALAAMDEGWSLLARMHLADQQQWPELLDEADRICANLETGLALRRLPHLPDISRTEPSL
jgi:hypothetical protein